MLSPIWVVHYTMFFKGLARLRPYQLFTLSHSKSTEEYATSQTRKCQTTISPHTFVFLGFNTTIPGLLCELYFVQSLQVETSFYDPAILPVQSGCCSSTKIAKPEYVDGLRDIHKLSHANTTAQRLASPACALFMCTYG